MFSGSNLHLYLNFALRSCCIVSVTCNDALRARSDRTDDLDRQTSTRAKPKLLAGPAGHLQFPWMPLFTTTRRTTVSVLNLSAPEILHRPAPQPGAPLFWRPPPRAPANPARPIFAPRSRPQASAARLGRGGCRPRGGPQGACESPRRVPCLTPKLEASTASTVGATQTGGAVSRCRRRRSRTEQTARIAPHNILCAANRNQIHAPQELENRLAPRAPRRLGQPGLNLVRRLRPAGGGCCGAGCGATVM